MAFMSWLPPLYNAEHVSTTDPNTGAAWVGEVPGRSLYRATCLLGPLTVQVVPKNPFQHPSQRSIPSIRSTFSTLHVVLVVIYILSIYPGGGGDFERSNDQPGTSHQLLTSDKGLN